MKIYFRWWAGVGVSQNLRYVLGAFEKLEAGPGYSPGYLHGMVWLIPLGTSKHINLN